MTSDVTTREQSSKGVTFQLGSTGSEDEDDDFSDTPSFLQRSPHPAMLQVLSTKSPLQVKKNFNQQLLFILSKNMAGENSITPKPTKFGNNKVTDTATHLISTNDQNISTSIHTKRNEERFSFSNHPHSNSRDDKSVIGHMGISEALDHLTNELVRL